MNLQTHTGMSTTRLYTKWTRIQIKHMQRKHISQISHFAHATL